MYQKQEDNYSLYLHIPFCRHRCAYCDFNTYAGLDNLMDDYVAALCCEIKLISETAHQRLPVHTVFFGGGTPSLLSTPALGEILDTINTRFALQAGADIASEKRAGSGGAKNCILRSGFPGPVA